MDRQLDEGFRKRRLAGRLLRGGVLALALLGVLLALPGWLRPSVRRAELRFGRIERGELEASLSASGTVVPAFERVLSSPIEARVVRVLKRPGAPVAAGEELLELDTSASALELSRLEDQIAKKSNEQEQLRLGLERRLVELDGQLQTRAAELELVEYRTAQTRKLQVDGLVAQDALKQAEAERKKARIELEQLQKTIPSEQRYTEAQIRGLALDLSILGKERDEARRQLELATTRSETAGVLTWIVPQEGATVRRGELLARVADLGSFRVEASVSDIHSTRLAPGQAARALIDGKPLPGRVASVDPTIENGAVKFTIALDESGSALLRNNLRVDVDVVTDRKSGVLLVRRGAFQRSGSIAQVFLVQGDMLLRRGVQLGLSGRDRDEVIDGLEEGDEVVLSDMNSYQHLEKLRLEQEEVR